MKKILLFSTLASILFLFSLQSCEVNRLCTEEFVIVSLQVDGDLLDEHFTRVKSTGKIAYQDTLPATSNNYIVVTDDYRATFENMSTTFVFFGKKDGKIVVETEFVVKADECHIEKLSGPEVVSY